MCITSSSSPQTLSFGLTPGEFVTQTIIDFWKSLGWSSRTPTTREKVFSGISRYNGLILLCHITLHCQFSNLRPWSAGPRFLVWQCPVHWNSFNKRVRHGVKGVNISPVLLNHGWSITLTLLIYFTNLLTYHVLFVISSQLIVTVVEVVNHL